MGDADDFIEYVFHHNMIVDVDKVVCADDCFERMGYRTLRGGAVIATLNGSRWNVIVSVVGDVECLGSLENQDDYVVSFFICKLAPERRGGKSVVKRGCIFGQP